MVSNWWIIWKAYVWKEIREVLATMKATILLCIITANLLQYMTIEEVMKLNLDEKTCALQLGSIQMYLVIIIVMFLGHTLINRFIYNERKSKTIHVMLASGMGKTAIWSAKMFVTIAISEIVTWISLLVNLAFIKLYYGFTVEFNSISTILIFVTMPLVCYGILALISIAYWYFPNMNIFGMIFPMVAYLGTWNVALQLASKFVDEKLVIVSVGIGVITILLSMVLIKYIPKERIASREFS